MWRVPSEYPGVQMASVYKRTQDKGNRRSCWYIGYIDHLGKRRTVKGFSDKSASERRAADLEEEARQIRTGLKPAPLAAGRESVADMVQSFREYLVNRDVGQKQIGEVTKRISRIVEACGWEIPSQIDASEVERQLGKLRTDGLSKETSNHYLRSLKQFTRWLVRTRRLAIDPLTELRRLNPDTDRRHARRALSAEELTRLVAAAEEGKAVEGIAGPDRALMYLIAAWTGYRKGEIGSLTPQSFDLDGNPPTVSVEAAFSKRRRRDTQVLHSELAQRIAVWLKVKKLEKSELMFRISARSSGLERKTEKMMRVDLVSARNAWLSEAEDEKLRSEREKSDFLKYQDHQNRFADFHSNRHTFITNLGRAGVSPKTAQTLARHSDIRLTMNVYSHTELEEKRQAIERLAGLREYIGSAPEAEIGKVGQSLAQPSEMGKPPPDGDVTTEGIIPSAVDATSQSVAAESGNIPGRVRTSNLRLRRPTLYPVELRGQAIIMGL